MSVETGKYRMYPKWFGIHDLDDEAAIKLVMAQNAADSARRMNARVVSVRFERAGVDRHDRDYVDYCVVFDREAPHAYAYPHG